MVDLKSTPGEFYGPLDCEEKFIEAVEGYYWYEEADVGSARKVFKPYCPNCDSENVKNLSITHLPHRYQCRECRRQFNIFKKTPFYRSKTPLKTWSYCYWYLMKGESAKNISLILELRKREVLSIKKKLFSCDRESEQNYLFEIATEYKESSRRLLLHRGNQYI